ncbi:MAG: hypothetical protein KJ630_04835 [Proteobacteria bacterium]|nr:hypothetical protein [Pseudomonadota bacterium]
MFINKCLARRGLLGVQFIEKLRQPVGASGLLAVLYIFVGLALISAAIWLDPNCDVKVLVTVLEVHFCLGVGLYIFSVVTQNNGLAIILSLVLLYITLLFHNHFVFYGLICILASLLFMRLRVLPNVEWKNFLPIIAGVFGLSLFLGLLVLASSEKYCDFLFEKKMMDSTVSPDILFHAGIVSMLRDFKQVSIGLHGFETGIKYHVLSHRFLAAIASLHQISSLSSYAYVHVINIAPLLFVAILGCAEDAFPSPNNKRFLLTTCFLCILMGGLALYPRLVGLYVLTDYWTSQSYILGLIFLLSSQSCGFSRSLPCRIYGMGFGVMLASVAKISTGAVGVCLYLVEIWRCRASIGWRDLTFCGGVIIFVGWKVLEMAAGNEHLQGGGVEFVLLHHLSYYMQLSEAWLSVIYFMGGHFAFSWIALFFCAWVLSFGYGLFEKQSFEKENLIRFLIANFVGLGVGVLSVSFFRAAGAAFYYFSSISMFLALPAILVTCLNPSASLRLGKNWWRHFPSGVAGILVVASFICVLLYGVPRINGALGRLFQDANRETEVTEMGQYLKRLQSIRNKANHERFLVYIPKKETAFWKFKGTHAQFIGFYVPAVAESPGLYGLPSSSDIDSRSSWGLNDYPRSIILEGEEPFLPENVLQEETKRMGFAGYVVVEHDKTIWHSIGKN